MSTTKNKLKFKVIKKSLIKEMRRNIIANQKDVMDDIVNKAKEISRQDDVDAYGTYTNSIEGFIRNGKKRNMIDIVLSAETKIARKRSNPDEPLYASKPVVYNTSYDYARKLELGTDGDSKYSPEMNDGNFFDNIWAWLIEKKIMGTIIIGNGKPKRGENKGNKLATKQDVFAVMNAVKKKNYKPRGSKKIGILTQALKDNVGDIIEKLNKILNT